MGKRRLFFALWPDEGVRRELVQRVAPVLAAVRENQPKAAPLAAEDLHLTLAFIGAASGQYQACLSSAARQVAGSKNSASFSFDIDRPGYFKSAGILWAGPESCPAPLAQLHQRLNRALTGCGYAPEPRAFKPHITLMRKAGPPQILQPFPPVPWPVNGFSLAESLPATGGRRYRVIEEYKFAV